MNNKNIYHCDIKESNILVEPKVPWVKGQEEKSDELNARLIDWGLSTEYIQGGAIPKVITNRPFQYNVPFSIVLFNPRLEELYDELLSEHPNPEYFLIRGFAIDFVLIWLKERGIGHFKVINEFIKCMFSNDSSEIVKTQHSHDEYMSDYVYTYYYITNYLTEILYKYTINGELNLFKYFNDVFIKNIDLWGFIMTYSPILEDFYNNYKKLNDYELKVFDKLKRIIIVFLFETSTSPINVDELTTELKELNILFNECKDKHSMRLQSSTISMTPSIFTNTSVS
jgi:serine/threonine protein kinase